MKQVPTEGSQLLGAIVQYLVATATWHHGLVYFRFQIKIPNSFLRSIFRLVFKFLEIPAPKSPRQQSQI